MHGGVVAVAWRLLHSSVAAVSVLEGIEDVIREPYEVSFAKEKATMDNSRQFTL